MSQPLHRILRAIVIEAFQRRQIVASLFVAISVGTIAIGLAWPKTYSTYTTILVENKHIIQPLMEGAAVTTDVIDRARIAQEVIYSNRIMREVLEKEGWMASSPSELEQERLIKRKLIPNTLISNLGKDIIRVEYKDSDPERTFSTTRRLADLFISESVQEKVDQSQGAFDFINKQVEEYQQKLADVEGSLKEFHSDNIDARVGSAAEISTRVSTLQTRIDTSEEELREAEIRQQSLEKQLSGEAELANNYTSEGQYRTRIAELQSQIETLRLTYQDNYPDIVSLKHQVQDLKDAMEADRKNRQTRRGSPINEDALILNPLYQQLRRDLAQAKVSVDTLRARLSEARRALRSELDRGRRMQGGEVTLAEMTRDYQVNKDIYNDLLRRRENARVSMKLDIEKQGLTFRIQEPAVMPREPSGLRFLHFVLIGFVAAILLPIALIYAILQVDPRIRMEEVITQRLKLPVLATVSHLATPAEAVAIRSSVVHAGMVIMLGIMAAAVMIVVRLTGVI